MPPAYHKPTYSVISLLENHVVKYFVTKDTPPEAILRMWDELAKPTSDYVRNQAYLPRKKQNLSHFVGKVNLPIDPLEFQRTLRDEWE